MKISVKSKNREMIVDLLDKGYTVKKICEKTGISSAVIKSVKRETIDEGKADYTQEALLRWLREHWHWKVENPPKKTSGKYRTVKKGDKGIHTPYRPDGIFR